MAEYKIYKSKDKVKALRFDGTAGGIDKARFFLDKCFVSSYQKDFEPYSHLQKNTENNVHPKGLSYYVVKARSNGLSFSVHKGDWIVNMKGQFFVFNDTDFRRKYEQV